MKGIVLICVIVTLIKIQFVSGHIFDFLFNGESNFNQPGRMTEQSFSSENPQNLDISCLHLQQMTNQRMMRRPQQAIISHLLKEKMLHSPNRICSKPFIWQNSHMNAWKRNLPSTENKATFSRFILNYFAFIHRMEESISNSRIQFSNTSSSYAQYLESLPTNYTMEYNKVALIILKASQYLLNNKCKMWVSTWAWCVQLFLSD